VPAEAYFVVSAIFHYLGPAFAVLLFARVDVLGVAWLRIASAAIVFATWRRPWRAFAGLGGPDRRLVVTWGVVLAGMNVCFYEAIARLPLATVSAIEFAPVVLLSVVGVRTQRGLVAFALAMAGVAMLTHVSGTGDRIGLAYALANAVLFGLYIVVAHRVASAERLEGIDGLAAAMVIAALAVSPVAASSAIPALTDPVALLAGIGVGICSSVIPYVTDQLAMARLERATYALMVALLPATAVIIGVVVLGQVPTHEESVGVALVIAAVALQREATALGKDDLRHPNGRERRHPVGPTAKPSG
jgi:inner membrane transporter RhtA